MRILFFLILPLFLSQSVFAQISGNVNYQNRISYPEAGIELGAPTSPNLTVSIKGMINIKADNYVAIFSVTQFGKTAEEVNSLIDGRMNQVIITLKQKQLGEIYVDMVSFVPVYEFETEKKVFSKRTYNEVPIGFEVKKNIHVKFTAAAGLNDIIASLATAEIYDLVRVDYFSEHIEKSKLELAARARLLLQEKVKNNMQLLGIKADTLEKSVLEGFRVVYPIESYQSYQAYSSSALNIKKPSNVNEIQKSTTLYYQPFMDKDYDFVINPTILEPVIQVMYQVTMVMNRTKPVKEVSKQFFVITPNGDLKNIDPERLRSGY